MIDSAKLDSDDERRQTFRIDMEKEFVDVIWTDRSGIVQERKVACLDFSRGGLKIDCDQSIEVDTQIEILFKARETVSQKLVAQVLRCVQKESSWYQIAVQF